MKILKTISILSLAILFLAACSSSPKNDEAKVSEAEEVNATEGKEITVTNEEADMEFVGTKPTGRHYGSIALSNGTVKVKDGQVTGGKLVFDLNQITVKDLEDSPEDHQKLVSHLQSDDFFDAENHPEVTFEIVKVEPLETEGEKASEYNAFSDDMEQPKEGEKITDVEGKDYQLEGATHEITGNLTMRGKTLAITVPARVKVENDAVQAFTKFSIDRTKWGVSYGDEAKVTDKAADQFIYNTVGVGFNLETSAAEKTEQESSK